MGKYSDLSFSYGPHFVWSVLQNCCPNILPYGRHNWSIRAKYFILRKIICSRKVVNVQLLFTDYVKIQTGIKSNHTFHSFLKCCIFCLQTSDLITFVASFTVWVFESFKFGIKGVSFTCYLCEQNGTNTVLRKIRIRSTKQYIKRIYFRSDVNIFHTKIS